MKLPTEKEKRKISVESKRVNKNVSQKPDVNILHNDFNLSADVKQNSAPDISRQPVSSRNEFYTKKQLWLLIDADWFALILDKRTSETY